MAAGDPPIAVLFAWKMDPTKSIKQYLGEVMHRFPPADRLAGIMHILEAAVDHDEAVAELVSEALEYAMANQLWKAASTSAEDMLERVGRREQIQRIVRKHTDTTTTKNNCLRAIRTNWGSDPQQFIPAELRPSWFGRDFLDALRRLSTNCKDLDDACLRLQEARDQRLKRPGTSKSMALQKSDIDSVNRQLKNFHPTPRSQLLQGIHAEGSDETPRPATTSTMQSTPSFGTSLGTQDTACHGRPQALGENGTATTTVGLMSIGASQQPASAPNIASAGFVTVNASSDSPAAAAIPNSPPTSDDELSDVATEFQRTPSPTPISHGPGYDGSTPADLPQPSLRGEAEFQCIGKEPCHPSAIDILRRIQDNVDDQVRMAALLAACDVGLELFCHVHLRNLARDTVGLKSSNTGLELMLRLRSVVESPNALSRMKEETHAEWFTQGRLPQRRDDPLVLYSYHPLPPRPFSFMASHVFERFAGPGSWDIWLQEGNIVVPGLFDFLRRDPEMMSKIDQEFAMYRHHLSEKLSRPRQGWMRNMFFSLIQQLVRQDPVWYALAAASRLDGNWKLITYPYITKDTDSGENTGFLHLDLNVGKFLEDGGTGGLVSSSLSLDDEDELGCTVVVKGFHRHMPEWYERLKERGDPPRGFTTNCSQTYSAADRKTFGEPEPVPCPAFGARFTRPDIIHGSTPNSTRRRRTLFAWHSSIEEDHERTGMEGALSWSEIAACHRDMKIPTREPSGQAPKHAIPSVAFAGTLLLGSTSAIGDALVGRRRWTDRQVIAERNVLLGDDESFSRRLVDRVRKRLLEEYNLAFEVLKEMEKEAYGADSFFGRCDDDVDMEDC
jgi:hypothetical protein